MPTVAENGLVANRYVGTSAFAPTKKPTRQIVREEIQRQKKLDKLEEKYQAGEISKFEYNIAKAMLNLETVISNPPVKTADALQANCVAKHKVDCVANHKIYSVA